jgi:DNA-binding CsgD family transcriptional regulator/ArsR family metal-binding transcriptional regulator
MLIRGYSDVSISRSGMRNDWEGSPYWGACFKLDDDVRELFPYINGSQKEAHYSLRPLNVQFHLEGVRCTLYPTDAIAAPFTGRDHAFDFIEALVVFLNDLYQRRAELTPSHKVHRQPASIVEILKALPRTNCRACGYPTCMAFAAALRDGKVIPEDCPGFAKPLSISTVYPVLGPDGTVASTFAIETGYAAPVAQSQMQPKKAPGAGTRSKKVSEKPSARYDRYGLQIQQGLTPREVEVLCLVAGGASNPEISEHLRISPHTVKSHIIHIFNKLNVNDRTQAAVWAVQNGFL